jgi:outer membrane protein OmpA-like peptidoglycan-associated protein
MKNRAGKLAILVSWLLIVVSLAVSASINPTFAGEQPTTQQILDALKSRGNTRSIGVTRSIVSPAATDEQRFIEGLRTRSTRSLTIEERDKLSVIAKDRPNIDLEINFDYNSATVGTKAVPALLALGRALSADEMKDTVFLINGHTDAKGSAEYNQGLSERRAEAVKRLLVEQFNIPAANLIAVGYGKSMLKNSADPFGGENRRVQIVNTEQKVSASR